MWVYSLSLEVVVKIIRHNIIKQCAFIHVGPHNITMGCPNPSANLKLIVNLLAPVGWTSHGYILRAHMNEPRLLNNDVMGSLIKRATIK